VKHLKLAPIRQVLIIGLFGLSFACGGLDEFEIEETARSVVPGASLLEQLAGDLGFADFASFDISNNQTLANQGVTKDQIDSVTISELKLTISSPMGSDFTFLDSLNFFVSSEGLETKRIASGGPFTMGEGVVVLNLDMVDLKPYAVASAMEITTQVEGRRPDQETTIDASITMLVDVNVGGVISSGI
jgi:hypothetical protein